MIANCNSRLPSGDFRLVAEAENAAKANKIAIKNFLIISLLFAEIFIELQEKGVHNVNFVTPTPWIPQIKNALDTSWERGLYLPTVYNCGGYESAEAIRSLRGYISVYLPDFKYYALGFRIALVKEDM